MIYVLLRVIIYMYIDVVTTLKKVSNLVVDTTISVRSVNSTGKYWFFPAFIVNVYRVKPTSEDLEFR